MVREPPSMVRHFWPTLKDSLALSNKVLTRSLLVRLTGFERRAETF